MNGQVTIYKALLADAPLIALLTVVNGNPALSNGPIEPVTWGPSDSTVSIYQAGIRDYTIDYLDNTITANCRAETENGALTIAGAVVTALNRKEAEGGGRFYCQGLPTIPPIDADTDSYNVPVEIQIKGQNALT